MTLTDAQRAQIYEAYKATHGESLAELLMSTIPVHDWNEVATKSDLADLRRDITAELNAFEARMQRNFLAVLLGSQAAVVGLVGLLNSMVR